MKYTFSDHLHNNAVWTAARAVQRRFTTTVNIKSAIEQTQLKTLINKNWEPNEKEYDNFHKQTAKTIIQHLKKRGVKTNYGQAAKMIAVYLKTAIIVRDSGKSTLAKVAHPPTDNTVLTNLHQDYKNLRLSRIRWTQLKQREYFKLINKLRTLNLENFWELEKYWSQVQK